jgi:hypothetical protein
MQHDIEVRVPIRITDINHCSALVGEVFRFVAEYATFECDVGQAIALSPAVREKLSVCVCAHFLIKGYHGGRFHSSIRRTLAAIRIHEHKIWSEGLLIANARDVSFLDVVFSPPCERKYPVCCSVLCVSVAKPSPSARLCG